MVNIQRIQWNRQFDLFITFVYIIRKSGKKWAFSKIGIHAFVWFSEKLFIKMVLCVQEVVNSIYIMSYYINWSNYLLDTRDFNIVSGKLLTNKDRARQKQTKMIKLIQRNKKTKRWSSRKIEQVCNITQQNVSNTSRQHLM